MVLRVKPTRVKTDEKPTIAFYTKYVRSMGRGCAIHRGMKNVGRKPLEQVYFVRMLMSSLGNSWIGNPTDQFKYQLSPPFPAGG